MARWLQGLKIAAAGCLLLAAAGCGTESFSLKPGINKELFGTEWRLVSLDGRHPEGEKIPTLKVYQDGRFGGFGGCNDYFGRAKILPRTILFGTIGSTRRYCIRGHALEHDYFQALEGAKQWRIKPSGKLLLYDDLNRLVFVPGK